MKKIVVAFLVFVFLGGFLSIPQAFSAEKLGYVNISRIFDEYNKTKEEYYKPLERKQKDYEQELEKKADEIEKMQSKLGLLNERQKIKKKSEIEEKIVDFQDYKRGKSQDLRKDEGEKRLEILQDIEKAIRQYAKAQGYTLVFNDRVLVYQKKEHDLTDKIIKIVNKNYKQNK